MVETLWSEDAETPKMWDFTSQIEFGLRQFIEEYELDDCLTYVL
jgi:hypothetical protein